MLAWAIARKLFIADLTQVPPPFSLGHWENDEDQIGWTEETQPFTSGEAGPRGEGNNEQTGPELSTDLSANLEWIHRHFSLEISRGLTIRHFSIGRLPAAVLFIDDQVDWQHMNRVLVRPLLSGPISLEQVQDAEQLLRRTISEGQVSTGTHWMHIVRAILTGSAVLLLNGQSRAVIVEANGWAMRAVDRPTAEITVRGPQEGFTEDIRTNLSLVRRRLRTSDLIVEWTHIGEFSRSDVAVLYLESVANHRLVGEVRRRLRAIEVDYIADSGSVEQLIEDRPYSIYPNLLSTERPDRVAAQIAEGYVGILIGNTPFALIVPGTLSMVLHSAEDAYLRWPFGTFLRLIRGVAFLMSILLPALYVAIANYHQEMIGTALMLAISGARETVPMPIVVEVWFMESMFELIREAGVRVPSVIGPTIGIVGALILGQAAVQAGMISPILVIITSATALASFAIPNYSLQFATRVLRFSYIVVAGMFGLVGMSVLFLCMAAYLASGNSFGVPWLSPLSPSRRKGDAVIRTPAFQQEKRPEQVRPLKIRRQPDIVRTWDNGNRRADEEGDRHDPT